MNQNNPTTPTNPTNDLKKPSIVEEAFSTDTVFCRSLVNEGYLTEPQMQQAARRYRLGRSKDGGVIFWEIDETQQVRDGKIMFYHDDCHRDHERHPDWVSTRLKAHYGYAEDLPIDRCLFGLHLLEESGKWNVERDYSKHSKGASVTAQNISPSTFHIPHSTDQNISPSSFLFPPSSKRIAIVESEKTAVILSELFPQAIWLASGGLSMLNVAKLYPLRDYKLVLFPDTDPEGKAYQSWRSIAATAQEHFKYPIRVSRLLEDHASPSQKSAKIDLVDFLFD